MAVERACGGGAGRLARAGRDAAAGPGRAAEARNRGGAAVSIERSAHRLYAHISWTTLDRLPLLASRLRPPLEGQLIALARRLDTEPVAAVALGDRVHLLLRYKPAQPLARLVGALKRGSAEMLERAGEPVTWGSGFAAASVGAGELRRAVRALAELAEREEEGTGPRPGAEGGRRLLTPSSRPEPRR